jgi:immune inhibitor A
MDRIINNIIAAAFCIFIATSAIFAVPPTNEVISMLKQKGEYENYVRLLKEAKERGYNANDISNNKTAATRTEKSSLRALAILVDFPNMPYTAGITSGLPQDFEDLLFSLETIPTGSLREYYLEVSYGNTDIYGDVAGWYTVSENYAYYAGYCNGTIGFGAYPYNAQRLVEDAIALADSDVDFSIYDNDGDGDVDILFVIHAGTGFEETGDNCEINSHQGRIFPRV